MERLIVKFNDYKVDDVEKLTKQIHYFLHRLNRKANLNSINDFDFRFSYCGDDFINSKNTLIITWNR